MLYEFGNYLLCLNISLTENNYVYLCMIYIYIFINFI